MHLLPILLGEVDTHKGYRHKYEQIKALCDAGASGSLLNWRFATKLKVKEKGKTVWKTHTGNFTSTEVAQTQFILSESHENVALEHNFHLIPEELTGKHNVMIRMDTMSAVGMTIDFGKNKMGWDGMTTPMKDRE